MGIGSPVFCTFHSPQHNNIGPARQQPWALFNFSESGRGMVEGTAIAY